MAAAEPLPGREVLWSGSAPPARRPAARESGRPLLLLAEAPPEARARARAAGWVGAPPPPPLRAGCGWVGRWACLRARYSRPRRWGSPGQVGGVACCRLRPPVAVAAGSRAAPGVALRLAGPRVALTDQIVIGGRLGARCAAWACARPGGRPRQPSRLNVRLRLCLRGKVSALATNAFGCGRRSPCRWCRAPPSGRVVIGHRSCWYRGARLVCRRGSARPVPTTSCASGQTPSSTYQRPSGLVR